MRTWRSGFRCSRRGLTGTISGAPCSASTARSAGATGTSAGLETEGRCSRGEQQRQAQHFRLLKKTFHRVLDAGLCNPDANEWLLRIQQNRRTTSSKSLRSFSSLAGANDPISHALGGRDRERARGASSGKDHLAGSRYHVTSALAILERSSIDAYEFEVYNRVSPQP